MIDWYNMLYLKTASLVQLLSVRSKLTPSVQPSSTNNFSFNYPYFKMFLEGFLDNPHHPTSSLFDCYSPTPSPIKILVAH